MIMSRCSHMGAVTWMIVAGLVVLPCVVVLIAILIVARPSLCALALALAVYCSAMLVWIILKCCQRQSDEEQGVEPASEQDLAVFTISKTPSCRLALPTLAPVPPTEDLSPPPYALVQALSYVPEGEAAASWTSCRQVFGETCSVNCPKCGPQARPSHLDDPAPPTYSELVESGAIPSLAGDSVVSTRTTSSSRDHSS